MDDAAAIVEAEGVDIVDVNMGLPGAQKVVSSGAGSALLKDFDRARVSSRRSRSASRSR